ncbi:MAG TPA: DUF5994 family protein [Ornithinibacter sp.]|nr:DUF5994 family protein [Ornithinibacter sp.]
MRHADPLTTPILEPAAELQPARLVLTSTSGSAVLDGVWWPRSTSLHREVPFLDVGVHDATHARIARLSYTVGTWDDDATTLWSPLGSVKVGWFITSLHPHDVDLTLTDNRRLVLRVIPPKTSAREGQACLRLAEEASTTVERSSTTGHVRPYPAPGPGDGSTAVARLRVLVDPVERALAANRLQRSFAHGAGEAGRLRQEALRAAREDLTSEQLAAALTLPVSRVLTLLASTDAGADRPWGC